MIIASTLTTNLAILVLAGFIGFVVISKVPNTLHTPLMSGTNAIHGIVLLGGLLIVPLLDRPTIKRPPSRTIPWIALVPDISGVGSGLGTLEMTTKPMKPAQTRIGGLGGRGT